MSDRLPICEFDLLAYADDPHRLEPRRRQALEAHLRGHPEDAAQVDIFRRQNLALRQRYDRYLDSPVPPHLYKALDGRRAHGRRHIGYAAAACIVAAGAAGWVAGHHFGASAVRGPEEAASSPASHVVPPPQWAGGGQSTGPVALAGLLEYGAGLRDLDHLGFSLVEAEPASGVASEAAQLTFVSDDGRRFTLVLRSRWQDSNPGFQVERRGDLSVVSWEEGRLAAELTSRIGREEALEIAEAVRASLSGLAPAGAASADGLLAVGSAEAAAPAEADSPVLRQQIR